MTSEVDSLSAVRSWAACCSKRSVRSSHQIRGLVTFYLLFVMELKTRRVQFVHYTTNANEPWMKQQGRELTNFEDGFLNDKRYLIMDRDGAFCPAFRALLRQSGVEPIVLPPKSPNLNAHLERFFRSLKSECLDRMIFFGEKSLRNACHEFLQHYHGKRNHQGLGNSIIEPSEEVGQHVRNEGNGSTRLSQT